MIEHEPAWLMFISTFALPIVIALLVAGTWWDRRRSARRVVPKRPEAWHKPPRERPAPAPPQAELPQPYTVYTREFDLELDGHNVPARLAAVNLDRPKWTDRHGIGWAMSLGLTAQFARKEPAVEVLAAALSEKIGDAGDLAVTLLLDQSGSMRGEPIASAAAALVQVEAALTRIGVTTEILGFSTVGWHGGHARAKWLANGRPARPGRLCALLHIVYKAADAAEWSLQSREALLHPDILRENIDGEALNWAAARLATQSQPRKLLIILSDGAPVDDSTLQVNQDDYLVRDIHRAIIAIEARDDMNLGAIGIGYAVNLYYSHSRQSEVGKISTDLIALIADLAPQHQPATALPSLGE